MSGTVLAALSSVIVSELSGSERVVALYASDMPDRFRVGSVKPSQTAVWIAQGAERIGVEELRRQAKFFYGHRLLEMNHMVPVDVQARHEQRFPKARRLDKAESLAAASKMPSWTPMSPEALARNGDAEVEGGCPCRGTGEIPRWMDEDAFVSLACPVHGRRHYRSVQGGTA
jgi:hypothetical protein